jgi:HD-GYP domain-containing protein (c-di-GMP phosphodiesterase class II)
MLSPEYRNHARAKPREAMMFWSFSNAPPMYEGLVRRHVVGEIEKAKNGDFDRNMKGLLRASASRLEEKDGLGKEKWSYTRRHSLEVGYFAYIIASEAKSQGAEEAAETDPGMVFAGGFIHDIGKTFLPLALVVKELGVEFDATFVHFCLLEGRAMTSVEKDVLRNEHVAAGTRYVRLFGTGEHIRTMLDMVGLHHVMYNGEDSLSPSYPSQVKGMNLPFQARAAKTADFISATLPRHYREGAWVQTFEDAIGYAVAVAGRELDPLAVRCLLTGLYKVGAEEAGRLIDRLKHPGSQGDLSDYRGMGEYVRKHILSDSTFRSLGKDHEKIERYKKEIDECAMECNVPPLVEMPK